MRSRSCNSNWHRSRTARILRRPEWPAVCWHLLEEQSSNLPAGHRLLGSTEVLESLIGKAKQLEGQQSKSGFTKMILGTAASVVKLTEQTVQAALDTVKVRDVTDWIKRHLGVSVQGQRYHAFAGGAGGTKPE